VPHLHGPQQEHGRHDDGAGLENAGVGLQHLGAVRQQHQHTVARAHAETAERVGEPIARPLLRHVGPLHVVEDERDVLAVALNAVLAEPRQVHGRRS
jgi:hypothetical protein